MSANPYIGQLSPAVGGGLGGLPRRRDTACAAAAASTATNWDEFVIGTGTSGAASGTVQTVSVLLDSAKVVIQTNSFGTLDTSVFTLSADMKSGSFGSSANPQTNCGSHNLCALSSTALIQAGCDNTTDFLRMRVITASGSTLTPQATNDVESSSVSLKFGLAKLASDKALCCYRYNSTGYLSGRVINVSGTTITPGARYSLNSVSTSQETSICALSATKALAVYRNSTTNYYAAVVIDVSGDVLSAGSPVEFSSVSIAGAGISVNQLCKISDTKAVLIARNNFGYLFGVVIDVSGTTPAWGTALTISTDTGGGESVSVDVVSSSVIVVNAVGATSYPYVYKLGLSGSTLTNLTGKLVYAAAADRQTMKTINSEIVVTAHSRSSVNKVFPIKLV